jgi:hypothetical protein
MCLFLQNFIVYIHFIRSFIFFYIVGRIRDRQDRGNNGEMHGGKDRTGVNKELKLMEGRKNIAREKGKDKGRDGRMVRDAGGNLSAFLIMFSPPME